MLKTTFFNISPSDRLQCRVVFGALILVGAIGWIDRAIGWEYSLFVFYAIPLALIVWKSDWLYGIAFAFLSAVAWLWGHYESHPYLTVFGLMLAVFGRLFYFTSLVVAVAVAKRQRKLYQERIERVKRARKLEKDIFSASERERQRIGRDLHDGLGPHLGAIGYAANFLANNLRQRDRSEAAEADVIRTMAIDAVALLRDLVQGICPQHVDGFDLSAQLKVLAETASRLSNLRICFYETGDDTPIDDPEYGMQLYRIAQEAVNNALRHGEANKIKIVLNKNENSLRLAVIDDGKGMVQLSNETVGMGLQTMRYRARALGGDLKIDSGPAEGTVVSCAIPSRQNATAALAP